jgi:hypothetical protein
MHLFFPYVYSNSYDLTKVPRDGDQSFHHEQLLIKYHSQSRGLHVFSHSVVLYNVCIANNLNILSDLVWKGSSMNDLLSRIPQRFHK